MMSWKIPSLKNPPAPKAPRLALWVFIMVLIGAIGFGLSLYLSTNEMLSPTTSNTMLMIVFVICPAFLVGFIRFFIYSLASYRHQQFTNMLEDAHQEWRYWAGKHLGILTHTRLTHVDEDKESVSLSSLPTNKDNILTLNALKSLASWEKQETVIQKLLAPIAEYYHQHSLTQPITLYWQAEDNEANWQELIKQEAERLSLTLESVEVLPHKSLSEWLLALYENPFEPKLYAILAFQLDATASEEAASLLLAPQGIYERLRAPIQAKFLRPISTDIDSFSEALKVQCEFQYSGEQLDKIWHSSVKDNDKGKCIKNYALQNVSRLSEHLYDIDTLLGKGSVARHVVVLSLVCEYPHYNLITHQNESQLLLQQIQV
ncbi:hypothetical protein AB7Y49_17800 [Providencia vermicola]|uniref:Type VI secretion protein n=1 Tax=Providencia vermicola TaxID=333965 RepID=A0AAX3S306_9GAMM|nr:MULTISPECIES: hypothetical protein [Providencia]ELX8381184.1 hypothetical protein [Providencia stuartii]EMD5260618.1 hypothetical protein [Providencia stuartii]USB37977.1 hypothetical protein M5J11_05730 [Providencia vermicola]WFC06910.1 hypothetical protein PG365_00555 [Providencia vermicola]